MKIPLHHRLGFRMGLALFAGLLVLDLFLVPLWNWLYWSLAPEWFDPTTLRNYAVFLEGLTPSELDALRWDTSFMDGNDVAILVGVTALYAFGVAALLGWLVSTWATRRVRSLAHQASVPDAAGVPGPFSASGRDELAALGATMSEMRDRVLELLRDIEERDAARRQWISEVSHDLRTPLTALQVSLEQTSPILSRVQGADERGELEELMQAARFDVRRVLDMAGDLLESARLDAGDELVVEDVPVGQLLRDVLSGLAPMAHERQVDLGLEGATGLPSVQADGRRLVRAFENLIVNSIQFASNKVTIRVAREGTELLVQVEDDGPGLPESKGGVVLADLRRHAARPDSAGIGLDVAEKVVRAHGGTICAANRNGGGAVVSVRLPVAD